MTDLERLARAIAKYRGSMRAWEDEAPADREMYIGEARAALEALLEPSEGMLANGVVALIDQGLDGPDGVGHSDAKASLQAMICHILENGR